MKRFLAVVLSCRTRALATANWRFWIGVAALSHGVNPSTSFVRKGPVPTAILPVVAGTTHSRKEHERRMETFSSCLFPFGCAFRYPRAGEVLVFSHFLFGPNDPPSFIVRKPKRLDHSQSLTYGRLATSSSTRLFDALPTMIVSAEAL